MINEDVRTKLLMIDKQLSEVEAKIAEIRISLNSLTKIVDDGWKPTTFDVKSFMFPQVVNHD